MKKAILTGLASITFSSTCVLAQVNDLSAPTTSRTYRCVARGQIGFHVGDYFGEDAEDLRSAQSTALLECQKSFSFGPDKCLMDECISFLPDGSGLRTEPTDLP